MICSIAFFALLCVSSVSACGQSITASFGQVQSRNYPNNYPDNEDCTWTITVPVYSIKLVFNPVFGIEEASNCGYDYVQIYSVTSRGDLSIGKFCGGRPPSTISRQTNKMKIKFRSDGSVNEKGFSLNFTAVMNGGWSSWSGYTNVGSCSATCGDGSQLQMRTRECNNPVPLGGGLQCTGDSSQNRTLTCNIAECPVNGGWSQWSDYVAGGCSVACGQGEQTETSNRTCNSPLPAHGGSDCVGPLTRTRISNCSMAPCPIDGGWSDWTNWTRTGDCSVTCGEGVVSEKRNRSCNNPQPMYAGKNCSGPSLEGRTVECSQPACQGLCDIDGTKFHYPPDFTKYYECVNNQPVLRACPSNERWDRDQNICVQVCPSFTASFVVHPYDCYKYIQCIWSFYIVMSCPSGYKWSSEIGNCAQSNNFQCS